MKPRDATLEEAAAIHAKDAEIFGYRRVPVPVCACGEPEDGGDFGWFDGPDGKTRCNACGKVQQK